MGFIKKIFGWIFKALAGLVILIAVFAGVMIFVSRQERALANEFVTLLGQAQYSEAHNMLSDKLKQEYPEGLMKSQFEASQVYTAVSFNNVNWSNGELKLVGSASTDNDCSSVITFVFVDELITGFQIETPCLTEEQSA